ncbi:MAG: hypothetical protein IIB19_02025, partial [Chloroflexi bacterium]|nr:hypothetical protein [Chloroflexota bacterium]
MRGAWLLSVLALIAVVTVVWAAIGGTSRSAVGGVATVTFTPTLTPTITPTLAPTATLTPCPAGGCPPHTPTPPGPSMELTIPTNVEVGEKFIITVSGDTPNVPIAGVGFDVVTTAEVKYNGSDDCASEFKLARKDGGPIAFCFSRTSAIGGHSIAVRTESSQHSANLNNVPGERAVLANLSYVCNTVGSFKITLPTFANDPAGGIYGDPFGGAIFPKSVDVGGVDVVDSATITCTPAPPKIDTDGDGCLDNRENGPDETLGGRRDYLNFWDFFDPNRDRSVTLLDFLAVLRHFGTVGDPATLDPDGPEPPIGEYWASADRGGQAPGGDP